MKSRHFLEEGKRIEQEYINNSYLLNVHSDEFYYEKVSQTSRMTKYIEDLDWYLVVEDCNPDKMNVAELTTLSIIIFLIGLVMMGIVFFIMSIRERKASKELMERRKVSITDDMTGLFNRRAYEEDCMKIQETNLVPKITMIMMDVNGLKAINDTYGHMAGDEFVVLLECTKSQLNDMLQTFEHITGSWKGTYQCELSISKGIVVAKEHADLTFDEMKELADKLMYEDKDEYYRRTGKVRRKI